MSDSLHQQLILQHSGHSRWRGTLEAPDVEVSVSNPTCGDEITLQLRVREGRIEEARFQGSGCSISQASASMMAAQLAGRSRDESQALTRRFTELMHGSAEAAADPALGDLRALGGVARFPVRVRCALLAWNALAEATRELREG